MAENGHKFLFKIPTQIVLSSNSHHLHAWVSSQRQSWCPDSILCHCQPQHKHGASSSVWPDHPAFGSWKSRDGRGTYDLRMGSKQVITESHVAVFRFTHRVPVISFLIIKSYAPIIDCFLTVSRCSNYYTIDKTVRMIISSILTPKGARYVIHVMAMIS